MYNVRDIDLTLPRLGLNEPVDLEMHLELRFAIWRRQAEGF